MRKSKTVKLRRMTPLPMGTWPYLCIYIVYQGAEKYGSIAMPTDIFSRFHKHGFGQIYPLIQFSSIFFMYPMIIIS